MLENGLIQSSQPQNNQLIQMMDTFDKFADYIINSEYRKPFEKTVKSEDGKTSVIVEKADIISCLMLGNELGITPMASIALGKKLNAKSYFSVVKGRSLGLDPITSINKIYNISTTNGDIQSLAVDIITKTILDSECTLDIIRDYEMVPTYIVLATNPAPRIYAGHKYNVFGDDGVINPQYFIVTRNSKPDEVSAAMDNGCILLQQFGYTYVTSVHCVRPKKQIDVTIHYSLQEAIDAGLYKGFHSSDIGQDGKSIYVAGRSNWNNHPATMLRNRVISITGRIVVADRLQGSYSHEESMEIINVQTENQLIQNPI